MPAIQASLFVYEIEKEQDNSRTGINLIPLMKGCSCPIHCLIITGALLTPHLYEVFLICTVRLYTCIKGCILQ